MAARDPVRCCAALVLILGLSATPRTLFARQTPAAQQGPAVIDGVVRDAASGAPVAGAVVSLGRVDDPERNRFVTDEKGRFVFVGLPPAEDYVIGVRHLGYSYSRYGATTAEGAPASRDTIRIKVAAGQWVTGLRVPIWRLGAISGTVRDERQEPMVGVAVRAFGIRNLAGREQVVAGPIATTDDLGTYRIAGLEPGRYFIGVMSVQSTLLNDTPDRPALRPIGELESGGVGRGQPSSVVGPTMDVDSRHRLALTNLVPPAARDSIQARAYPSTFYPGSRTLAEASDVPIQLGESRNGININLAPLPAWTVSGRIENLPTNRPPTLLRLMTLGSESLGFGAEAATTLIEQDGRFTFLNVPDGRYTLMFQGSVTDLMIGDMGTWFADAPGFEGGGITVGNAESAQGLSFMQRDGAGNTVWGRVPVTVAGSSVESIQVAARPAVSVRGQILLEAGTTLSRPDSVIGITVSAANGDPSLGRLSGSTARGDTTHAFTVDGLLGGRYLLRGFNALGIVSMMWHGRDITNVGLDTSAGVPLDDVTVTLTDKFAEITGYVSGQPSERATVLAFPTDRTRWVDYGWTPLTIKTVRTEPDGAFQLTRLPQGEYFLVALPSSAVNRWVEPTFLEAVMPSATRIDIKWGEKKLQDLKFTQAAIK